ncbi:acyl-CoA carboxylase epsilon subunit [Streptomyces rimosus]
MDPLTARQIFVRSGHATDEELAALATVLLARATALRHQQSAGQPLHRKAGWRRLERTPAYSTPHSWRS